MKQTLTCALFFSLAVLAACSRSPRAPQADQEKQALPAAAGLRAALEKYLSGRSGLDLAAMDIEIKQVTTQGNTAEAQVEFRTKTGKGSMQMTYLFERQGNMWVVKGSRPPRRAGAAGMGSATGGSETVQPGQLPPGHPPLTQPEKAQSPPAGRAAPPPKQQ